MRPETAISLALLALKSNGNDDIGFREDVIAKLALLRSRGLHVFGVRLRPGIDGVYSDEVSDFISRLAIAGYVVQESPIRLTENGSALLEHHISENLDDKEVVEAAKLLNVKIGVPQSSKNPGTARAIA